MVTAPQVCCIGNRSNNYLDIFLVQINAVDIQRKLIKLASHFFNPRNDFFTLQTNKPTRRENTEKGAKKGRERANNFLFKEGGSAGFIISVAHEVQSLPRS